MFFEMPQHVIKYQENDAEQSRPLSMSKRIAFAVGDRANLTKLCKAAKVDLPVPGQDWSTDALIGELLQINLEHYDKNDGTKGLAIGDFAPLMAGIEVPEPHYVPISYGIEDGENETFKDLPEWLQESIASATNWPANNALA